MLEYGNYVLTRLWIRDRVGFYVLKTILSRTLYRVLVVFPGLFTHYKYRSRDLLYAGSFIIIP
jgi:hypothetical protein